jgi:predicted DNA-binding transcriptional regulator AlpA
MSVLEGQIRALLEQLSQAISALDGKDCPSIIGGLEQLKALAWSRMTAFQPAGNVSASFTNERFLSAKEVAEKFQVTVKWLYKHKKKMPHTQPTRKTLRFPEGPIQRWFANRKQKADG